MKLKASHFEKKSKFYYKALTDQEARQQKKECS